MQACYSESVIDDGNGLLPLLHSYLAAKIGREKVLLAAHLPRSGMQSEISVIKKNMG